MLWSARITLFLIRPDHLTPAGNLERLRLEYRRTERRTRALEDVLMPEIDLTIKELETRLEEIEQEEAIRVRQA